MIKELAISFFTFTADIDVHFGNHSKPFQSVGQKKEIKVTDKTLLSLKKINNSFLKYFSNFSEISKILVKISGNYE